MPAKADPKLYTARSQTWVGNRLYKPARMGGRPVAAGDPILATHPQLFEPYNPRVHEYEGRERQADGNRQ